MGPDKILSLHVYACFETNNFIPQTEEIHDSRVAGANKNGGFLNQGGRNYGYDRSGANAFGSGGYGPMAI